MAARGTAGRDTRGILVGGGAGRGSIERGTVADGGGMGVRPGKGARSAVRGSSSGIGRGKRNNDFAMILCSFACEE